MQYLNVGWVERSETQQIKPSREMVVAGGRNMLGFAALYPTYKAMFPSCATLLFFVNRFLNTVCKD